MTDKEKESLIDDLARTIIWEMATDDLEVVIPLLGDEKYRKMLFDKLMPMLVEQLKKRDEHAKRYGW